MIKARYTVVLKALMDNPATMEKLTAALSKYPLYERRSKEEFIPAYIPTREQLNKKILNHYKYREIGFETIARFLDELEIAMEEIMPYYNMLFLTADQDYNIIWNVDYQKTFERHHSDTHGSQASTTETGNTQSTEAGTSQSVITSEHEANDEQTTANNDKSVKSTEPQGTLTTPADQIDTITHADEVNWNKANGTTTSKNTSDDVQSTDTETSTNLQTDTNNNVQTDTTGSSEGESTELETTKGNFGVVSAQDLVLKFRETIINIEQQIINDSRIQELFMLIY